MLALLEEAAARDATLAVFPELAFTTFFPRWLIEGDDGGQRDGLLGVQDRGPSLGGVVRFA